MAIGDTREIKLDDVQQRPLTDIFMEFEPVSMSGGYMIVKERPPITLRESSPSSFRELGSSGFSYYGQYWDEEYNPDLRGESGIRKYDQMRRSDATVRASLRLKKLPIMAGTPYIKPASDSAKDKNAARQLWWTLNNMSMPLSQFLAEASLSQDFGHSVFEKVFDQQIIDGESRITWKKLSPRHPLQIMQWIFDDTGGPEAIEFYSNNPAVNPTVVVPIEKLLVISHDREASNLAGISALRSAYKHWYFKDNLYKIDAIQKERHGIGIPVIKLPINFTSKAGPNGEPSDLQLADEIGRNLRVNEKAHVVLPPMWELMFAKVEGYPVNPMESIAHHDKMIMVNILGHDPLDTDQAQEWFLSASHDIVNEVTDSINHYAARQLVDYNYTRTSSGYPQFRLRLPTNWRDLSFTLRNFVGADIIRADELMEVFIREELSLPPRDPETERLKELQEREDEVREDEFEHEEDMGKEEAKRRQQEAQKALQRTKARGTQPGLPRQTPSAQTNTGSSRVGGASNNRA